MTTQTDNFRSVETFSFLVPYFPTDLGNNNKSVKAWKMGFWENCPRGKLPPSLNPNANPKPNLEPDQGAIFLGDNFPDTGKWITSIQQNQVF